VIREGGGWVSYSQNPETVAQQATRELVRCQPWSKFCCNAPHELIRQNSLARSVRQSDNVANVVNLSSSVFQDSLSQFCHIFGRGYGRRPSKTLFIICWHQPVLETLKPFLGLRLAYGTITKCSFKHSVCFQNRLAEFETQKLMQIRCSFTSIILAGRYNRRTALTRRHKNAQNKHTHPYSRTPLGRMIHKG
jgi:hypothetical protein